MGLYDKVVFECKACYGNVEFQSKADKCLLSSFNACEVPLSVAIDLLDGEYARCEDCNKEYSVKGYVPKYVHLELEE